MIRPREHFAWLYSTGEPVRLCWAGGRILELEPAPPSVAPDVWLAPALIDLQVNGFAGIDFQRDGLSVSELRQAILGLHASGCGRFLLTLMSDDWATMLRRLTRLRQLRARSPLVRYAVAGWHLEGPFLSAEPGFCGAHDPGAMRDPRPEDFSQLRAAAKDDPVLVTVAPERKGALPAIRQAVALGIRVSLGHTNAAAETLQAAVAAGATSFTHLGNACPQLLDRHDNILWRALDTPGLSVSLIPDQIHVARGLFRLVHRILGSESIYYVTDAMAAAGAGPGTYSVGRLEMEVGKDGIVRQPGRSNFAGSSLRPVDAIFKVAAMTGFPWQKVWACMSVNPARLMGFPDTLEAGRPADFCLLRFGNSSNVPEVQTFVQGIQRPDQERR